MLYFLSPFLSSSFQLNLGITRFEVTVFLIQIAQATNAVPPVAYLFVVMDYLILIRLEVSCLSTVTLVNKSLSLRIAMHSYSGP